jgi:hypothetical protein
MYEEPSNSADWLSWYTETFLADVRVVWRPELFNGNEPITQAELDQVIDLVNKGELHPVEAGAVIAGEITLAKGLELSKEVKDS